MFLPLNLQGVHPCTNTATTILSGSELQRFLAVHQTVVRIVDFDLIDTTAPAPVTTKHAAVAAVAASADDSKGLNVVFSYQPINILVGCVWWQYFWWVVFHVKH